MQKVQNCKDSVEKIESCAYWEENEKESVHHIGKNIQLSSYIQSTVTQMVRNMASAKEQASKVQGCARLTSDTKYQVPGLQANL